MLTAVHLNLGNGFIMMMMKPATTSPGVANDLTDCISKG
jgi:hypothetical protein